ncbi:MAG: ribosome maturation factor RimM [Chloroflexota bacterium]
MPETKKSTGNDNSGSPLNGEPVVYLSVGIMRRSHGIRGDMVLDVMTDFPERLKPGTMIYVGDKKMPLKITRRRPHNEGLILGFEGIKDSEQAAKYRSQTVFVPAADRPALPEGEYYHHQILGLQVEDEDGKDLGIITEIIETGANDVYVVAKEGRQVRDLLLPAIKEVLLDVNLDTHKMKVHLLDGLLDAGDETPD